MKRLQFTALGLHSSFAWLFNEILKSLHIMAPSGEHLDVMTLDEKENALRGSAAAGEVECCYEEHCTLVYKADAS